MFKLAPTVYNTNEGGVPTFTCLNRIADYALDMTYYVNRTSDFKTKVARYKVPCMKYELW